MILHDIVSGKLGKFRCQQVTFNFKLCQKEMMTVDAFTRKKEYSFIEKKHHAIRWRDVYIQALNGT